MSKKLSLTIVAALVILGSSLPAMACHEGLTPGFWKNHPEVIMCLGYSIGETNCIVEQLSLRGGGENALRRHAMAAILNAQHPCIAYPVSECWIVANFWAVLGDKCAMEALKDKLDCWNNLGASL
jgi:hypothetical protein